MTTCFIDVAAELLRMTLTKQVSSPSVTVYLSRCNTSPNRARGVPVYYPRLALSWGPGDWPLGVQLVDRRGYLVEWTYPDVYRWLVSSLSGARCQVVVSVGDGASMPKKWTAKRIAAAKLRIAQSGEAVRADAAAKVATVEAWAESVRKVDVILAAGRMVESAGWLDAAHAVAAGEGLDQWGASGGGGGV